MVMLAWPELVMAAGCIFFLLYLRCWKYNTLPINWPVVGMLPSMLLNIHRVHDWTTQLVSRNRLHFPFRGPWFGCIDFLGTADPANVRYMVSTNFSNFPKGPEFKEIFDVLGDGIFNSDMDQWRTQRRIGNALINHPKFLRFLIKTFRQKVEHGLFPVLDEYMDTQGPLDLQDVFKRFMFDNTCIFLTGTDPTCLAADMPKVPIAEALDNVLQAIFYRHVIPKFFWKLQKIMGVGVEKKLTEAWRTLDDFIGQCVFEKRQQLRRSEKVKEGDDEGMDLLTSYLSTEEEEEQMKGLNKSDKFLRDTMVNYMFAGRDTVSSALTWFFWLLSKNPSAETKLIEELRAISPKKNQTTQHDKPVLFDIKQLNGLVYLHGAICECLRLFPPVPFGHRVPIEQDILPSGHTVHPKSRILTSLYAMGRMEEIWGKDCLQFKPERWISRDGRVKYEPPYKFVAFNAGPRICLGKEVAFTQMNMAVATIMYNYRFEPVEGHPVVPKNSIVLHMEHGLLVRIKRRLI
ncbi:hypothetical protein Scep_018265 [Stephania cephalantha]|uniref:Cytochrome P450 n=1 Tax=Stephania cephalantha TaxID=152367 RepID=A0AAP0NUE6_9MAGN